MSTRSLAHGVLVQRVFRGSFWVGFVIACSQNITARTCSLTTGNEGSPMNIVNAFTEITLD